MKRLVGLTLAVSMALIGGCSQQGSAPSQAGVTDPAGIEGEDPGFPAPPPGALSKKKPFVATAPLPDCIFSPDLAAQPAVAKQAAPARACTSGCSWNAMPAVPYDAVDVAYAADTIWVVCSNARLYKCGVSDSSWSLMIGSQVTHVSVDEGYPWATSSTGNIYEWGGSGWSYRSIPDADAVDIAVGKTANDYVWALDDLGRVWKYDSDSGWEGVTSSVNTIDASLDGTLWVSAGPYRYVYYKEIGSNWQYAGTSSALDVAARCPDSTNSAWITKSSGIYERRDSTWTLIEQEISGQNDTLFDADAIELGNSERYPAAINSDDKEVYYYDCQ